MHPTINLMREEEALGLYSLALVSPICHELILDLSYRIWGLLGRSGSRDLEA